MSELFPEMTAQQKYFEKNHDKIQKRRILDRLKKGANVRKSTIDRYGITQEEITTALGNRAKGVIDDSKYSMQRWREDPKNVFQEKRNALIRRIRGGAIPLTATLEMYKISNAEINKIRESANLPPVKIESPILAELDVEAVLGAINYEKERIDKIKLAEEKAKKLHREAEQRIKETKKIVNEAVEVIQEAGDFDYETLPIETVLAFYDLSAKNGEITPETSKNYKTKLGVLFRGDNNIIPKLKNAGDLIKSIKEKYTNINTIKAYIQAVLKLVTIYPSLKDKIGNDSFELYRKEFKDLDFKSKSKMAEKTGGQTLDIEGIREAVFNAFPEWSKQRLIMEFYRVNGFRDDLGDVILVKNEDSAVDDDQNYLIYKTNPVLILNVYKTDKTYGQLRFELPEIIYTYLKKQGKKFGDYMISLDSSNKLKYGQNGTLSGIISNMLKVAGIKTPSDGAINMLRHAFITSELEKISDANSREDMAKRLGHSPITSLTYLRKITPKN